MTNKDGGAAFPEMGGYYDPHQDQFVIEPTSGMSLRDYFAAKAMQVFAGVTGDEERTLEGAAEEAYAQADAMLAARATPQPDPVREELVELVGEFLKQIDHEDQVIRIEPSRGCIECTHGTRPNVMDTGLCLLHRATAALSKAKEGQS